MYFNFKVFLNDLYYNALRNYFPVNYLDWLFKVQRTKILYHFSEFFNFRFLLWKRKKRFLVRHYSFYGQSFFVKYFHWQYSTLWQLCKTCSTKRCNCNYYWILLKKGKQTNMFCFGKSSLLMIDLRGGSDIVALPRKHL